MVSVVEVWVVEVSISSTSLTGQPWISMDKGIRIPLLAIVM